MRQFILTLCFFSVFLALLVQAESTLDKRQPRKRKRKTCQNLICSSDRIMALSASCAARANNVCAPACDLCEGGYYCPQVGRCSGSGRQKLNDSYEQGQFCDNCLYCDLGSGKCLGVSSSSFYCYGDTECKNK
jgi:hypothetical protein